MALIGNIPRVAWQFDLHPTSPRSLDKAFGTFQLWVAGRLYGKGDSDSTGLACSFDNLARIHDLIKAEATFPIDATPLQAFSLLYAAAWDAISLDATTDICVEKRTAIELMLAPDGDEAFDDGSHAYVIPYETYVVVVAGKVRESVSPTRECAARFHMDDSMLLEMYYFAHVLVPRADFDTVLAECLNAFRKMLTS